MTIAFRPPPQAVDAERVMVASVLEGQLDAALAAGLHARHFYDQPSRWIFTAACELRLEGHVIDLLSVVGWLERHGRLAVVGGKADVVEIYNNVPVTLGSGIAQHAETILTAARARDGIATMQRYAAQLSTDPYAASALLVEAHGALGDLVAQRTDSSPFAPMPPTFFLEPDAEVDWLLEELSICAGPPLMIAGYGYSGKTAAAQALAIAVASGTKAFGWFRCRKGRTLHLDYEQGMSLTKRRYRRLARAAGLDLRELANDLGYLSYPRVYLDQPDAEAALCRATEGVALLIGDSLKAFAPSLDENSSDIRRPLDMLARVSEKTGVIALVVHHARKPNRDDPPGSRYAIRGNSAIFDACSNVIVLDGKKEDPKLVVHHKERQRGQTHEDFNIVVEDVEVDGDPKGGLRVAAQVKGAATRTRNPDKMAAVRDEVVRVVRDALKIGKPLDTRNAICARISGASKELKLEAIRELVRDGELVVDGKDFKMGPEP